jgi:hypothetical protein
VLPGYHTDKRHYDRVVASLPKADRTRLAR